MMLNFVQVLLNCSNKLSLLRDLYFITHGLNTCYSCDTEDQTLSGLEVDHFFNFLNSVASKRPIEHMISLFGHLVISLVADSGGCRLCDKGILIIYIHFHFLHYHMGCRKSSSFSGVLSLFLHLIGPWRSLNIHYRILCNYHPYVIHNSELGIG